jgi:hypothetical protein
MTESVLDEPVRFIVRDDRRRQFQERDRIRKMSGLRVAIADEPAARVYLAHMLPNVVDVPYREKKDLDDLLASGADGRGLCSRAPRL